METSGFIDVFAWASFIEGLGIKVETLTVPNSVESAFGQFSKSTEVNVMQNRYDGLAIPGGMEFANFLDSAYSKLFVDVIQHFHRIGAPIAAVCVASLALANARILKNMNATVYHSKSGKHKQKLVDSAAIFVDQPLVHDRNLITSSGPGTSVEVALSLLKSVTDASISKQTRAEH